VRLEEEEVVDGRSEGKRSDVVEVGRGHRLFKVLT
jgi:hypothetical protein